MNELMVLVDKAAAEFGLSKEERQTLIDILIEKSGRKKRVLIRFSTYKVKDALKYIEENKAT